MTRCRTPNNDNHESDWMAAVICTCMKDRLAMNVTAARRTGKCVPEATIVIMTDRINWIRKLARVLCCLEELFDESTIMHD